MSRQTGEIRFTRVKKHGGAPLCKRITLGEDGRPHSDGSPCAMSRGTAERVRLNGSPAANLSQEILDLGPHEAVIQGDLADGLPDEINLERADTANPAQGTHGRTRKTFCYRPGQPSLVLFDYDQKAMPDAVRQRLASVGGYEGALAALIAGYTGLARVSRASTSAGIFNTATGEHFPGSGGMHVYAFAKDGTDIPRFLETLHKRAWLAGFGWIMVGARGQLLIRSIIDPSVGLPERLVFEGPPQVVAPLAQDQAARQPQAHEGAQLDTAAACPALTPAEGRRFAELVTAAKRAAKPEADEAIEKAAVDIAHARSIDLEAARAVVSSSLKGELTSNDMLQFDDGDTASVADVLADPERYHERTLADPVEGPAYGRCKGKVYRNANGSVVIHSFAHGGINYRLRHDAAYIEARLTAAGDNAPFVLAGLMLHVTGMDAVTRERLRNLAAKLGKVSRTAVKATIGDTVGKARRDAGEASRARRPDDTDAGAGDATTPPHGETENWKALLAAGIEELNRTYFVASLGGTSRVVRLLRDEVLGRERLVFSREADIKLQYAHRHYLTGFTDRNKEIWKGLGEAWLSDCRRRTCDRIEMITDGTCPRGVYNLWRGFGVEPKAGSWPTLEAHLRAVVCSGNEGHYRWLLGWLAYCVQNPGRQAEVAVVLRGLKGAGKGMVGQMLMRIFQNHALHITNSKHLVGNFNAHLVDALFLFLDEAFWAGDKPGEGTLKALITERTIMIEPKGVDAFQMPNRLKILMSSNNDWVVSTSADERRYFVLDVSDDRKGDKAYFTALADAIEGDELAALLDGLLQIDLGEFDHRNPPHTDGLNKQKLIGGDSLHKFWLDCLDAGCIVNAADGGGGWPLTVPRAELHDAYLEHAHAHGDRHPLTEQLFGIRLRKLCPGKTLETIRPWAAGERPRHYKLDHLERHREAFCAAMNIAAHEWPDWGIEP